MPIMFKLLRALFRKEKMAYYSYLLDSYGLINICQQYTACLLHYGKFSASFVNKLSYESK